MESKAPQKKSIQFLPLIFLAGALILLVSMIVLERRTGNELSAFEVGAFVGRLAGALFWPWVIWMVIRMIKGRESAPNISNFVFGGGLILLPLIGLLWLTQSYAQPSLEARLKEFGVNQCQDNFGEYSELGVSEEKIDSFCACYSTELTRVDDPEDLKLFQTGSGDSDFAQRQTDQALLSCKAGFIIAEGTALATKAQLPVDSGDGFIVEDSAFADGVMTMTYRISSALLVDGISPEQQREITAEIVQGVCNDSTMRRALELGASMEARYIDDSDDLLFRAFIKGEDCSS